MLYRLANDVYRVELNAGGIVLVKAAKKSSPGQLDLFGGGGGDFDESKHSRGSDGKFSSGGGGSGGGGSSRESASNGASSAGGGKEAVKERMAQAMPEAVQNFRASAQKFHDRVKTMPVAQLRDFDVDAELHDEHFLPHVINHVTEQGQASADDAMHADDIADNLDDHFPEAYETYNDISEQIQSTHQQRIDKADKEADAVFDDTMGSFYDDALEQIKNVGSREEWESTKQSVKAKFRQAIATATEKFNEVGADHELQSDFNLQMHEVLDELMDSHSENDWDDFDDE